MANLQEPEGSQWKFQMFDRQSILVTGASSGIGEACVRHLVAQRAHVAALDLCSDKLAAVFGDEANVARVAATCPGWRIAFPRWNSRHPGPVS